MWLYVAVCLTWVHGALYKIANPLLPIVYTNVATIVTHNILNNGYVTCMRLIIYQAEASVD